MFMYDYTYAHLELPGLGKVLPTCIYILGRHGGFH